MEQEILNAILDYLTWTKVFHYRQNSGAMAVGVGKSRRFIRFGAVGAPDIVCVVKGVYVGLEVKTPEGRQNENQKKFQQELEAAGGRYFVVRSVDEVVEALKLC